MVDEDDLCPICRRFAGKEGVPDLEAPDDQGQEAAANACAVHPGNPSVEVCSRCGNFMCSLCRIRVGRQKICSSCFNILYGQDKAFVRLASFGERLGALLLDMLVFFIIWVIVNAILALAMISRGKGGGELYALMMLVLVFGLWSFYIVGLWAFTGATLGKKVVGIKIVGPDRKPPSFLRSLARYAMYWVSAAAFFIGFIWAAFESKNRTWHDLVAGTEVIKTRRKKQ